MLISGLSKLFPRPFSLYATLSSDNWLLSQASWIDLRFAPIYSFDSHQEKQNKTKQ